MSPRPYTQVSDEALARLLRQGDMGAFEEIYHRYWPRLHSLAYKRLRSREATEEIVQDVFTKLWQNREKLVIHVSLTAYLLKAAKYAVLDCQQRELVRQNYREAVQQTASAAHNGTEEAVLHNDLHLQLQAGIERLPTQCRSVFRLSRQEDLSMKEIATRLDISEKTVENHLGNALKKLRLSLREFLGGIAWVIASFF